MHSDSAPMMTMLENRDLQEKQKQKQNANRKKSTQNSNNNNSKNTNNSGGGSSVTGRKRSRREFDSISNSSRETKSSRISSASTSKLIQALRLREPMSEKEAINSMGWPNTKQKSLAPLCLEIENKYENWFDLTQCDTLMYNMFAPRVMQDNLSLEFVFEKCNFERGIVDNEDEDDDDDENDLKRSELIKDKDKDNDRVCAYFGDNVFVSCENKHCEEDMSGNKHGFDAYLIESLHDEMDICKIFEIFSHFGRLISIVMDKSRKECVILYNSIVNQESIISFCHNTYIYNNYQFSIVGLAMNNRLRMQAFEKLSQEKNLKSVNRKARWNSIETSSQNSMKRSEYCLLNRIAPIVRLPIARFTASKKVSPKRKRFGQ